MALTSFQNCWLQHAREFDLRVQVPFRLTLAGQELFVPVLLEEFGAARGMLLVTDSTTLWPYHSQIIALGFGVLLPVRTEER